MSGKLSQAEEPAEKQLCEGTQGNLHTAEPPSRTTKLSLRKLLVFLLSACGALTAISYVALRSKHGAAYEHKSYQIPPDVLDQFHRHDRDRDGLIDPYEFASLLNNGVVKSRDPATPAPVRKLGREERGWRGGWFSFFNFVSDLYRAANSLSLSETSCIHLRRKL